MTSVLNLGYVLVVFTFLAYIFISFILSAAWRQEPETLPATTLATRHQYLILVPCVDEAAVIGTTVRALLALDFVGQIVVIDDGSQDATADIVQAIQDPRVRCLRRVAPNAQQGKGAALNFALDALRHQPTTLGPETVIGVVDADGQLTPNTFARLDRHFSDPQTAAVQLRVKMYPRFKNGLQASQDLEFFTVNNRAQLARNYWHTVGLSGNGQFFRLDAIVAALGPHPWGNALLDDYELTIKLMLHGLHISYEEQAYVSQQAVSSLKKFVRQRSRWVQGNLDCQRYLPRVLRSTTLSWRQKVGVTYFLSQPYLNLVADSLIVTITWLFWRQSWGQLTSLSAVGSFGGLLLVLAGASLLWGGTFTLDYLGDLRRHQEPPLAKRFWLSLPLWVSYVYLALFFSIVLAFARHLTHHTSWLKTSREEA